MTSEFSNQLEMRPVALQVMDRRIEIRQEMRHGRFDSLPPGRTRRSTAAGRRRGGGRLQHDVAHDAYQKLDRHLDVCQRVRQFAGVARQIRVLRKIEQEVVPRAVGELLLQDGGVLTMEDEAAGLGQLVGC